MNGELKLQSFLHETENGKFKGSASTINEAIEMIIKKLKRKGYNAEVIAKAQLDISNSRSEVLDNPVLVAEISHEKYEFALPFIKMAYEYAFLK